MVSNDSQRANAEAKFMWEKPLLQELDMNSTSGMMMIGMDAPGTMMTADS